MVPRCAGLRVPGAFDGFELTVRAILGQRVSVRAATTLAGRLAARYGELIETPFEGLDRLSPAASRLAEAPAAEIASLGIAAPRAASIRSIAQAVDQPPARPPTPVPTPLQPASHCRRFRESATGLLNTSRCERSGGLTPSRPAIWFCSGLHPRNHRSSFATAPKPGAPGGLTQPCIFGNPSTVQEQESLDD